MKSKNSQKRYSARLLFQFRIMVDGDPGKRRICEDRIVILTAKSAKEALVIAKRKGNKAQFHYRNDDGCMVYFEFIGVRELLSLEAFDEDQVWYGISEKLLPMERKNTLIPATSQLNAMRFND